MNVCVFVLNAFLNHYGDKLGEVSSARRRRLLTKRGMRGQSRERFTSCIYFRTTPNYQTLSSPATSDDPVGKPFEIQLKLVEIIS